MKSRFLYFSATLLCASACFAAAPKDLLVTAKQGNSFQADQGCLNQSIYVQLVNHSSATGLNFYNTFLRHAEVLSAKATTGNTLPPVYHIVFQNPNFAMASFLAFFEHPQQITLEAIAACACSTSPDTHACQSSLQIVGTGYNLTGDGTLQNPYIISF